MRVRPLVLVAAISALLLPAAAVASDQTPTAAGYSAADVPALGVQAAGASGRAADDPALAGRAGTAGACVAGSATAVGHSAGVDPSERGSQCPGRATNCATAAAATGGATQGLGSGAAGSTTSLRVYGAGSLSVMDRARPAIVAQRGAQRTPIGADAELLVWPNVAPVLTPVASGAERARAACVPNPCVAAANQGRVAPPIVNDADNASFVLRLPFSRGVAEAGFGGLLLAALACGGAALVAGRRRRRRLERTPLW